MRESLIQFFDITIKIKDINVLNTAEVAFIYDRLSRSDSPSNSSIRKELDKRYINIQEKKHPEMAIALVRFNDVLVGWVGSRPWLEEFKGETIITQTVECFVDPKFRRKGVVKLGLQSLITTGKIDKTKVISVYAPEVVDLAKQCGCNAVTYWETNGR